MGLHISLDMCRLLGMQITGPTSRVLEALLADPTGQHYGYELMKAASVQSGTLYPMLKRFEDEGVVTSHWESEGPMPGGRPPRRYYRLTGDGVRLAQLGLAEYRAEQRAPAKGKPSYGFTPAPGSAT